MPVQSRRGFLLAARALFAAEPNSGLRLWYRQPAPDWNEALPIGNGRLGAMIFGGIESDRLQLNNNTLYSDGPGRRDLKLDISVDFDKVIAMLRDRRFAEADDYITRHWLGRAQPCYQPMADLLLHFEAGGASNYTRELDLHTAISTTRYEQNGVTFTREYFASHPGKAIVVRLSANSRASLSLRVELTSVHPTAKATAGNDGITLPGQVPAFVLRRDLAWVEKKGDQWKYPEIFDESSKRRPNAKQVIYGDSGTRFNVELKASTKGGTIRAAGTALEITGADEVLLVLSSDGLQPAQNFTALKSAHLRDYQLLFNRVSLHLGELTPQSRLPTDERITKFSNDRDPALAALYFHYGRYLMIAGSRPGGQPLNLQGMWNADVIPPWAGAYTTNINAEMNYWPAEVANLSECHQPLFDMIRELTVTGGKVAREMYHRRGWVEHHNTTIWRDAQPVDNAAMPSFWPMGGAWLSTHLWEHYLFTGDRQFLETTGYPAMKGAAEFLSDWLIDNGKGRLVTAAGCSPEITFQYADADGKPKTAGTSMGPTMDLAIARELFAACIRASEILGRDPKFRAELKSKLERLLPYQVGSRGQLQEWAEDWMETDQHHRHISHLFPLHPGSQITRRGSPELFEASRRALELRGDEGTGWSRAWKINFWARMEDGDHAYKMVRNLLRMAKTGETQYRGGGVMPNLFCSHPPFQIDGNFGGAAGIAEMLLQSHTGEVHLLPALPGAWPSGSVRGLCARGGFVVDMTWADGKLIEATLYSKLGNPCRLRYGAQTKSLATARGKSYPIRF